jgi:multiple sugar transport system permease protein
VCAVTVFPIYWMLLTSVQPSHFSMIFAPPLWPAAFQWNTFDELLGDFPIIAWFLHTTLVAFVTTNLCLAMSILGAFSISCFQWRGRTAFGFFLLITLLMPEAMIVIPIFVIYRNLHLVESLTSLALIDTAFSAPIGVWILKNLFDGIPTEIREAAFVDGSGHLGILGRIILPLSGPGLVAVAVVAFFYAWNEYLFASTMITKNTLQPASVGLSTLITMMDTPVQRLMAAGLVVSVPPMIFHVLVQRYIVAGLTAGAIKG